jgi:hypothetical protein
MTYGELSEVKTTGFNTNHIIGDVVNNGRFCFGKHFKTELVPARELEKIKAMAIREGLKPVVPVWIAEKMRAGASFDQAVEAVAAEMLRMLMEGGLYEELRARA